MQQRPSSIPGPPQNIGTAGSVPSAAVPSFAPPSPSSSADPNATAGALALHAQRLINTIEFQLNQLEDAVGGGALPDASSFGPGPSSAASAREARIATLEKQRVDLSENINLLAADTDRLVRLVNDPGADFAFEKRELWRKKAAELHAQMSSLRASIVSFMRSTHLEIEGRRGAAVRERLLGGSASASVAIEATISTRNSLTSSLSMVDEAIASADNVLGSLRTQRGSLKSAHRKALDVATSLGVSASIMGLISRRTTTDKILVYGGMLLIVLFVFMIWWLLT